MTARIACLFVVALALEGADDFYLGAWKVESAVVAPWWTESQKPAAVESKSLIGKTFKITPKGIDGPKPFPCRGARFDVQDFPAGMLFQGAFDEMRLRDKSVDPNKVAATLGFRGTRWKTLETGCSNELDFHFLDPNTAAFALNNYVYTIKRQ